MEDGKWGNKMARMTALWRNRSIVFKLFFSVIFCMLLLLGFNWLLNNLVLENYYQQQKKDALAQVYDQVNRLYAEKEQGEGLTLELDKISSGGNYKTMVASGYGYRLGQTTYTIAYLSVGGVSGLDFESGFDLQQEVFFGVKPFELEPGSYLIGEYADKRLGQSYLTLSGLLDNGYYLLVNTPLQAISESVEISNRFLLLTGVFTLLLSGIFVFWIARGFARPITKLSAITNGIARLDFTQKYEGKNNDEIGRLGQSINTLSTELERNLSELKTLNAQLVRDNEIKTKQDQLRRDFIANASHELKTPIALIRAYAEGIAEDISSDAQSRQTYCDIIQDEAEKMNMLIKKMTSLMQLESGEEELSISRFEINGLIAGVLRKYAILLDQRKIIVTFSGEGEIFVWGDEYFIENVINNYVSNAANHVSPKGEIQVRVEPVENGASADRVRVSVFNTGNPIAKEDIGRIWESFYKADKARSRQYGGTGLGLSVVAAIMRAHNMPFGVRNVAGGVEFWFELET